MKKNQFRMLWLLVVTITLVGCGTTKPADTSATPWTWTIPANCVAWYDGCNNCSVKDGKADACTMMYCETPQAPKCLQFKE